MDPGWLSNAYLVADEHGGQAHGGRTGGFDAGALGGQFGQTLVDAGELVAQRACALCQLGAGHLARLAVFPRGLRLGPRWRLANV